MMTEDISIVSKSLPLTWCPSLLLTLSILLSDDDDDEDNYKKRALSPHSITDTTTSFSTFYFCSIVHKLGG